MVTGDFGTFGLLWILMNLGFLLAFIVGAFILTKWLARRARAKKQGQQIQLPENGEQGSQLDDLKARYERGNITQQQYQQIKSTTARRNSS